MGPLDIKEKRKEMKEELVQGGSDAFRSIKEHVHEMKEDLKDSLREKGVEFKKGAIEGESDARHDAYPHMPSLDEKLNEAAHDTGYFAGAAKEKLAKAGEKISEAATDAKESLKGKARNAADTAKETVHIAQDKLNDAELAAKTKAEDAKEKLQETRYNAKVSLDETKQHFKESVAGAKDSAERTKDSLKESLKEAGQKAKEGLNYATEKVKEDAEDLIGHAKWKAEYAARKAESVAKEHFNRLQVRTHSKMHQRHARYYADAWLLQTFESLMCVYKDELKAEGHHIGHGAERIKDAGANVKQEVKREAEELKEDAKGAWGWLKGVFSGTTHSIATKLKEEEAHTKSSLARQLHKAADAKEEEANRARMEYEAMLARVYGADEAAKEVHRKLRSEQLQMKHAAELAAEKARAAKESFLETAAEFKHKAGNKLEEVKEKAKELAHEAKERAAETMRGTAESELAAECAATEEHIVREAKSLAEADLKHQHGCDLKQEARLAEELRKAKEQREYITETDNRPPMHTHHGVGDSIRRAFRALNPLAMFA
jgi:hypothetical protein